MDSFYSHSSGSFPLAHGRQREQEQGHGAAVGGREQPAPPPPPPVPQPLSWDDPRHATALAPPRAAAPSLPPAPAAPAQWFSERASARHMYESNHVVPPPDNPAALQQMTEEFIVIDSRDRNHSEFPEPNEYTISLAAEYRDVKELALISYNVPSPQHPIRASNSAFYFNAKDPIVTAEAGGAYAVSYAGAHSGVSGAYAIDYSKDERQSVAVSHGYYESDAFVHADDAALQQDALSNALETALRAQSISCTISFLPQSTQYTIETTFASPFATPTPYEDPRFLNMLFRGEDTYYGETSVERVNISGDPDAPVWQTNKIGKLQTNYLPSSIGPVIGFPPADLATKLTGTVLIDSGDLLTLVGNGTRFTQELQAGVWIFAMDLTDPAKKFRVRIDAVTDDEHCSLTAVDATNPPAIDPSFAWSGRVQAPWVRNLTPDAYIVMRVAQCETLESFNETINKAYMVLPTRPNTFEDTDPLIPLKRFNPTQGRLDKLTLSYHNPDGSLYNFMGQNHLLLFKMLRYKQNVNYSNF